MSQSTHDLTSGQTSGEKPRELSAQEITRALYKEFDLETLYVECARCGAPVILSPGKITQLVHDSGLDEYELDSSCIMLSDGCPQCTNEKTHAVRICRLCNMEEPVPPVMRTGHA